MEFPLPHLAAETWFKEITATCGGDETVVRVRERLKTEIKLFFSKYLFCIMITLTRAPLGVLDFHALLGGGV